LFIATLKVMSKIKITQVKSGIDRMERQKRTLKALGLRRMLHMSYAAHALDEVGSTRSRKTCV
jgi:large subunit ribosomal protein L30